MRKLFHFIPVSSMYKIFGEFGESQKFASPNYFNLLIYIVHYWMYSKFENFLPPTFFESQFTKHKPLQTVVVYDTPDCSIGVYRSLVSFNVGLQILPWVQGLYYAALNYCTVQLLFVSYSLILCCWTKQCFGFLLQTQTSKFWYPWKLNTHLGVTTFLTNLGLWARCKTKWYNSYA